MLHAKGEGVKEAPGAAVGWFEAAAMWGYEPSMARRPIGPHARV